MAAISQSELEELKSILTDDDVLESVEVSFETDGIIGVNFPKEVNNAFEKVLRNVGIEDESIENSIYTKHYTKLLSVSKTSQYVNIVEDFAEEMVKAKNKEDSGRVKEEKETSEKAQEQIDELRKMKERKRFDDEQVKMKERSRQKFKESQKNKSKNRSTQTELPRLSVDKQVERMLALDKAKLKALSQRPIIRRTVGTGSLVGDKLVPGTSVKRTSKKKKSSEETPSQKAKRLQEQVDKLKIKLIKCKEKK